jgi:hypothetical protein
MGVVEPRGVWVRAAGSLTLLSGMSMEAQSIRANVSSSRAAAASPVAELQAMTALNSTTTSLFNATLASLKVNAQYILGLERTFTPLFIEICSRVYWNQTFPSGRRGYYGVIVGNATSNSTQLLRTDEIVNTCAASLLK